MQKGKGSSRQKPSFDTCQGALAREFGISRETLYRYATVKKRWVGKLQNELYAENRRRVTVQVACF
jgi:hypothetical protein